MDVTAPDQLPGLSGVSFLERLDENHRRGQQVPHLLDMTGVVAPDCCQASDNVVAGPRGATRRSRPVGASRGHRCTGARHTNPECVGRVEEELRRAAGLRISGGGGDLFVVLRRCWWCPFRRRCHGRRPCRFPLGRNRHACPPHLLETPRSRVCESGLAVGITCPGRRHRLRAFRSSNWGWESASRCVPGRRR